ncbi:MAG: hypothetical protein GQ564_18205 [Bacteroidales bacterium]|nr:hypothetical protein [Bacteroidales bacterium]
MNKNNIIFIIITFIIFCSCDRELFEDFIVKNNLSTSITVVHETNLDEYSELVILPNTEAIVLQASGYGNSVHKYKISEWFKLFEVTKDDTVQSKVDYLLDENWEYKELSDTHAEYRLVVDSTHFE